MTTIADVARYAGVSVATVSHVMNRTRHVEPETAERVRAAITALRYSPNSLARSLRRGETKTIGLLLPDNSNPFFASVARQIEDAGFVAGYTVILCNSDGSAEKEERYLSVLMAKQIDGLIFAGSSDHARVFASLSAAVPAVLLDREIHSVNVDSVLVDHDHGGYLAGRHLVGLGHKRIGFAGGRLAMERLLEQAPEITAVFACNDLMAMGAITALRSRGLRVPDDMSLIGFDDIPYAVTTWPPLTTIAQPVEKIGTRAVSLLLERVVEPEAPSRREVLTPVLVERESCAAARR
ncbi:MAG: LacI family transcriptional regulator [Mesorhizobium sp.]|nr:MAG: LacI family transcriptional regulator [Mesorhizobium sp.]